jgi:hypothetical protein
MGVAENVQNDEPIIIESDLYAVYKESRKIGYTAFNLNLLWCTLLILVVYSVFTKEDSSQIYVKLIQISDIGLTASFSVIGFLIAGFTIFATITEKKLFLAMAKVKKLPEDLSYLKYTFLVFMRIFSHFWAFGLYAVGVKVLGSTSGPIETISNHFFVINEPEKRFIISLILCFSGSWLAYVFGLLQSFIYNIYALTIFSIEWERLNNKIS